MHIVQLACPLGPNARSVEQKVPPRDASLPQSRHFISGGLLIQVLETSSTQSYCYTQS